MKDVRDDFEGAWYGTFNLKIKITRQANWTQQRGGSKLIEHHVFIKYGFIIICIILCGIGQINISKTKSNDFLVQSHQKRRFSDFILF